MSKIYNSKSYIFSAIVLLLIFQIALYDNGIGGKLVQYFDDLIECILILALLVRLLQRRIRFEKTDIIMIVGMAVYDIIGLLSNVKYMYQPAFVALTDLLVCNRFLVYYFAVRFLINKDDSINICQMIYKFSIVFVPFLALICLYEFISPVKLFVEETRYGLTMERLCFAKPNGYAAFAFCFLPYILIGRSFSSKIKLNTLLFALSSLTIAVSLESKTLGALLITVGLFVVLCIFRITITPTFLIVGGTTGLAALLYIGLPNFKEYYSIEAYNKGWTRIVFLVDSIKLAIKNFPLGTGFGTFGSSTAFKKNTPLYEMLDYPNRIYHYVGHPWNHTVCDQFWPIIIAQCGFLGFAGFMCVVIGLIVESIKTIKVDVNAFVASCSILLFILIATIGEASFFQCNFSVCFITFALISNVANNKSEG